MRDVRYIYGVLAFLVVVTMLATPAFSALTMRDYEPPFEGTHDDTQTYDGGNSLGLKNAVNYTQITNKPGTSIAIYNGNVYFASNGDLIKAVPPSGETTSWTLQYQDIGVAGILYVLSVKDDLVVATKRTVYHVDGGSAYKLGSTDSDIITLAKFGNDFLAICDQKIYRGNPASPSSFTVYEDLRNPEGVLPLSIDPVTKRDGTQPKLDMYPYKVKLDGKTTQIAFPPAVHEYIQDNGVIDMNRAAFIEKFGTYMNAYLNYYTQWSTGVKMFSTGNAYYDFFLNSVVQRQTALLIFDIANDITEGAYQFTDGTVAFSHILISDDDLLLHFRGYQENQMTGGGILITNVGPYYLPTYDHDTFYAQDLDYYYHEGNNVALYAANAFQILINGQMKMTRIYSESGGLIRYDYYEGGTSQADQRERQYTHGVPVPFVQNAQLYSYVLIDANGKVAVATGSDDITFHDYGLTDVNDLTSGSILGNDYVNYVATAHGVGYIKTRSYATSGIYTSPVEHIDDDGYITGVTMSWQDLDPLGLNSTEHSYYVQVTRDNGANWHTINNTESLNWTSGSAATDNAFQYRVVFDSPSGFATDRLTDFNYTLKLKSDIQISQVIDDPALHEFGQGQYYTCGYDPDMDKEWVRPVDMKLDLKDCYFGNKTLSVFWDWGDPYAWGEPGFVMPTCPDLPANLQWYRYDTFYISPNDGFQLNATQHFYTKSGTYTISIDVYEGRYSTQAEAISANATHANITKEVTILDQPPKLHSVDPWNIRGEVGDTFTIKFNATDADGTISEYHFGSQVSTTPVFSWTATSTIDLTKWHVYVVDNEGQQSHIDSSTMVSVQITKPNEDKAPVVDYTYSPLQPTYLDTVHFTQQCTDDGTITNYTWDMGDGTILYGPTADHNFALGMHYVTLSATDDAGQTVNKTYLIVVSLPSGDLVISQDTVIEDYSWTMAGNIIVQNGSSLTLKRSRVTFACTTHGQYGIVVYGSLKMYNSSITGGVYGVPVSTEGGIEYHMQKMYIKAYSQGYILLDHSVLQALNYDYSLNQDGLTMKAPAVLDSRDGVIDGVRRDGISLGVYLSVTGTRCEVKGTGLTISGGNEQRGMGITAPVGTHDIDIDSLTINYFYKLALVKDSTVKVDQFSAKFGYDGLNFAGTSDVDISGADTISVWGEVIETDDSANLTAQDSTIKGSGDGTIILYAHGNSLAYINKSTIQSAGIGIKSMDSAHVVAVEPTFKTLYTDFIGYGSSLVEIKNYVALQAKLEGTPIKAHGIWLVDNRTVATQNWTTISDYHLMTYAKSTSGTVVYPTCVVAVGTEYGVKQKPIKPYKRMLVVFQWGQAEVPVATPADDVTGTFGTSVNALLIVGAMWALVGLAYWRKWGSSRQRLWGTIAAGVLTPVIWMWDRLSLAYSNGVWDMSIIVPLGIVAAGGLLYHYRDIGRGVELKYWSAIGGSAIVAYLYLSGYGGLLFVVSALILAAVMGYYALRAGVRGNGFVALVLVYLFLVALLAYLWLGWTPGMYIRSALGLGSTHHSSFWSWLLGVIQ